MKKTTSILALALACVLTVSGCAVGPQARRQINQESQAAHAAFARDLASGQAIEQPVRFVDRPFVAFNQPVAQISGVAPQLPPMLAEQQVTLMTGAAKTLPEIVAMMSGDLGIPVRLDSTLSADKAGKDAAKAPDADGMVVSFVGPLPELLAQVTNRFAVHWSYQDGMILVSRYSTRIFHLPQAFAGTTDVSGSIGGSGSSNGGAGGAAAGAGGSSSVTTTVQNQVSVKNSGSTWKSLEDSIKAVIDGNGDVTASPDLGILVVRTTPQRMQHVADLISAAREILLKRVMLRMRVYSVNLTKSENANFNLNAIITSALSSHGITTTLGGGSTAISGPGSVGVSVLNNTSTPSTLLVQALSTLGNVSTVYDNPIVTQNGQAVPISNVVSQGYAASTQTTVTPNVGSTTSITPGTVTYGYSMTVLPRVIDDSDVALQVQLSISNLLQMQTFGQAGNQIQLPTVQSEPFIQRTLLKTGQTVMLMGLQQSATQDNESGTGTPRFWALGGGRDAKLQRQLLVVLVTPEILQ